MALAVRNPVLKNKARTSGVADPEIGDAHGALPAGSIATVNEPFGVQALYWAIFIFPDSVESFPSKFWALTACCWSLFLVPMCVFLMALAMVSETNCVICKHSAVGNSTANGTVGANAPGTTTFSQLQRLSQVVYQQVRLFRPFLSIVLQYFLPSMFLGWNRAQMLDVLGSHSLAKSWEALRWHAVSTHPARVP